MNINLAIVMAYVNVNGIDFSLNRSTEFNILKDFFFSFIL